MRERQNGGGLATGDDGKEAAGASGGSVRRVARLLASAFAASAISVLTGCASPRPSHTPYVPWWVQAGEPNSAGAVVKP